MKKTKNGTKALLAVALVMSMLFSMCVVGFFGASAASPDLKYEFAYKNAGYAEGRISIAGDGGTYYLYWADDTKALDGYHEIAKLTAGTKPFEMGAGTAIPAGATKVIAIQGTSEPKDKTVAAADAIFEIPADKRFKAAVADKQYSFEALSDLHIQIDDSYWYLSKPHFANALEVAAGRGVDFMTICGDMVNGYSYDNLVAEFPMYHKILAASNYNNPIYETNGNHEMKGSTSEANLALYKKATGLNTTTGALQSTPYYEKTINGDHYIFLVLELSGSPNESSEFTKEQLDWFEGLLKKYSGDGHKIIVNQHALIKGYGAGDDKVTPYYGGSLVSTYAEVKRLMSLMEAYPEIIVLSGHSHIDFKYGYNFDNENGKTCYTVHIPSTSSTTHPKAGGGLDYKMDAASSQGYIVDVYEDYVVLNGTDLAKNAIYPAYTYFVDYTGEKLVKNELSDLDFDTVKVTVDVSALTDAPTEVICNAYNSGDATDSVAVPMTRNSDGTYSADVMDGYSQMYFIIKSEAGQLNTSSFAVAECKVTLGYNTVTYTPTGNVLKNVNAHFWGTGDGTVWPGVKMTLNANGDFELRIPASEFTGIIFNEGKSPNPKTENLDIKDYLTVGTPDVYEPVGTTPTEATEPTTQPTTTKATEPATTVTTEPTEPTTEVPEPDALAPIVIVEKNPEGYFTAEAYPADGATDVEYRFSVNGVVYREFSKVSAFIFEAPGDYIYILDVTARYPDGSEHTTTVTFEVVDGEPLFPEMPERPTKPTEPTTQATQPTTTKAAEPTTTQATQPTTTKATEPIVSYMYGDVDLNGKVNVKDATTVQKYAAMMLTLDEVAMIQADVTADGKVNVKDATSIQKLIAKIIDVFPIEESKTELVAVGGALDTLKAEVKNVLATQYQYASYDAYMALKKAYMNSSVTQEELTQAYNDFKAMKSNNVIAAYGDSVNIGDIDTDTGTGDIDPGPDGEFTVYFENNKSWTKVNAYAWNNSGGKNAGWPGAAMEFVRKGDNGFDIYKITLDGSVYKFIIFNDGNNQTVDIKLPSDVDGKVYYLNGNQGAKFKADTYPYTE